MAGQKHKSKYKAPKDMEKSQKIQSRKDLKDYTMDNKDSMNPNSTGEKQSMVPRKTDKQVIDDVENMVPKTTDKDRTYKKLEDGDYDPKHAAKYFDRNQEEDTKEYFEKLEDIDHGVTTKELQEKINRLSEDDKERLVREYIRRKIAVMLREQEETEKDLADTPPPPPAPEEPAVEEPESAPEAPAEPAESDIALTPEDKFVKHLKTKKSGIDIATSVIMSLGRSIKDLDASQKLAVYKMLQTYAISARNAMGSVEQ